MQTQYIATTLKIDAIEPIWPNSHPLDHLGFQAKAIDLKQVAKVITIDWGDRNRASSGSFVRSLAVEVIRHDEQALICASL